MLMKVVSSLQWDTWVIAGLHGGGGGAAMHGGNSRNSLACTVYTLSGVDRLQQGQGEKDLGVGVFFFFSSSLSFLTKGPSSGLIRAPM